MRTRSPAFDSLAIAFCSPFARNALALRKTAVNYTESAASAQPPYLNSHLPFLVTVAPRKNQTRRKIESPSIHRRRLDHYWRRLRYDHRSRGYHHRSGCHDRRSWRHDNWRWGYNIAHNSGGSDCRSGDAPSAMVTVMVVMMTRNMMMAMPAMKTMSAMRPWTRTGEYKTGHCHRCDHYCQFLVHVFLLFLSLLTSWLGNVTTEI